MVKNDLDLVVNIEHKKVFKKVLRKLEAIEFGILFIMFLILVNMGMTVLVAING